LEAEERCSRRKWRARVLCPREGGGGRGGKVRGEGGLAAETWRNETPRGTNQGEGCLARMKRGETQEGGPGAEGGLV
jgi:hypothetical protein